MVAKLKRKFLSEFAVNLFSARWLLMPATQISADGEMKQEEAEVSRKCHIYLVCERPAVVFDQQDFSYSNGEISGSLVYKIDGVEHREPFRRPFPLLDGAVELKLSAYPYREIQALTAGGECVRYLPANSLSIASQPNAYDHAFRQLKVLYVGQAFGGGNRTALDRLRSHSTLQKILADTSYHSPDSEIMVLTVEYAPYRVLTSMDGRAANVIHDARDTARFTSIIDNPLKLSEQISLAEAALIRYFQPKYNKIFKKKFPSREMKVLSGCYEYDFSALAVEIDTDDLNFSLYSDNATPKMHHIINIDLVDHEDRASFFHFGDGSGNFVKLGEAIGSRQNEKD